MKELRGTTSWDAAASSPSSGTSLITSGSNSATTPLSGSIVVSPLTGTVVESVVGVELKFRE
jgi:hypothetical protein